MTRQHPLVATLGALGLACLSLGGLVATESQAWATPANYTVLGPTPTTYSTLTGTAVVFSNNDDSATVVNLPSTLNFTWFGQPVTQISVGTNGWIAFDSTTASACSSGCYSTKGFPIPSTTMSASR